MAARTVGIEESHARRVRIAICAPAQHPSLISANPTTCGSPRSPVSCRCSPPGARLRGHQTGKARQRRRAVETRLLLGGQTASPASCRRRAHSRNSSCSPPGARLPSRSARRARGARPIPRFVPARRRRRSRAGTATRGSPRGARLMRLLLGARAVAAPAVAVALTRTLRARLRAGIREVRRGRPVDARAGGIEEARVG